MVTVLMPTYKQASFIVRAVNSLLAQSFTDWEFVIINDGSPDNTRNMVDPFLRDSRIRYFENTQNEGLGYCLNRGLEQAVFDLISYLPSDDIYYADHLQRLYELLTGDEEAVLAYSDVESEDHRRRGVDPRKLENDNRIQLVQILHRKFENRWVERAELESDSYGRLFLEKLEQRGRFITHDQKTCEWINHPSQRTKIIGEKFGGGINKYKAFYHIREPLKFQSSSGPYVNEHRRYRPFRDGPGKKNVNSEKGLKILLVGELSYYPERVHAFEERGHTLYGLWMTNPTSNCNSVGPLAFGNIENIPFDGWEARVEEIAPDIIYALLNTQAVQFAHSILQKKGDIPFVWQIKESPTTCITDGLWNELFQLYTLSDGRIFSNEESRDWFNRVLPESDRPVFIMDGELPPRYWFSAKRSPLLSDSDNEVHTMLAGRPIGLFGEDILRLAGMGIHLHFYGEPHRHMLKKDLSDLVSAAN